MSKIKVSELFYSIQGEGRYMGVPSVFLRTFGCNFTCDGFGMPKGEKSDERNVISIKADSFKNYSNEAIYSIEDSQTFLKGTFSNQDDLISADVAGVSLSSRAFGQDLINLGNAIDFNYIKTFGLPSSVLQILKKYNALTQPVILALLTSGLSQNEIESISNGNITPTK